MRRIACHHDILLDCVEFDGVHIRQSLERSLHLLFVPCGCLHKGNGDPLNWSTQKVHQIRNLVGAIDHRCARQTDNLTIRSLVDGIVEPARNLGGVHDTRDQIVDLINDDHAVVERICREATFGIRGGHKLINVLGAQSVVVDKIEALSNDILDLGFDNVLSCLGQILVVRVLTCDGHEELAVTIQKSIGDVQRLGFSSRLVIQPLLPPVLLKGVNRITTLAEFRPVVLLE